MLLGSAVFPPHIEYNTHNIIIHNAWLIDMYIPLCTMSTNNRVEQKFAVCTDLIVNYRPQVYLN